MRNVSGIGDLSCLFSKCQVLGTHEVSQGKYIVVFWIYKAGVQRRSLG